MDKIQKKLNELVQLAEKLFYPGKFGDITFKMNSRLTSTAGRAFYDRGYMDFSTSLYEANQEEFLVDTVPHEFAHMVAFRVYNSVGHDNSWRYVVQQLGGSPNRCHSYQVAQRKQVKTYQFKCACRVHEFTPQRYAWVKKGKQYKCNTCNQLLVEV